MDIFTFPPIAATLDAAYGALMGLAALLEPVAGAAAAATAIILVTLIVRAALIPTGVSQAKAEQVRARLAPKLRALQERYRRDPERLQRETMKLYADENASPFAGCLPVLIQAPVVGIIYALFLHTAIAGHANSLLTEELFGVPLGTSFVGAVAQGGLDPADDRSDRHGRAAHRRGRRGHPSGASTGSRDDDGDGCRAARLCDGPACRRAPAVHDRGRRALRAARGGTLPSRHGRLDASNGWCCGDGIRCR